MTTIRTGFPRLRRLGRGRVVLVLLVLAGVLAMHGLASGNALPAPVPGEMAAAHSTPAHRTTGNSLPGPAPGEMAATHDAPAHSAGTTVRGRVTDALVSAHEALSGQTGEPCQGPCEDRGCGHLDHADGACSAAGIGGAYVPPDLPPAGFAVGEDAAVPTAGPAGPGAVACRAPPDLAELQLLRI